MITIVCGEEIALSPSSDILIVEGATHIEEDLCRVTYNPGGRSIVVTSKEYEVLKQNVNDPLKSILNTIGSKSY